MTISSSLNAGVAGLNANAARLSTISDNIANSATAGYKRSTVDFHAMVVGSERPTGYVAGGVRSTPLKLIGQQGAVTNSENATDLAVNGRGFLPVTPLEDITGGGGTESLQLRTTGSFRLDELGWLKTSSNQVLMGWPIAADGTVQESARDSLSGLQAIKVDMNQLSANPTTDMAISLNLPATETRAGSSGGIHSISHEYFNSLGMAESLDFTFTPTVPAAGAPASNSWKMEITDSANGMIIGTYDLLFDTANATAGRLLSVTSTVGGGYDPSTGRMDLTTATGPLSLSIGKIGEPSGISQLSSNFVPAAPVRNGSPVSNIVSVEIDNLGTLHGVYDQGFKRPLYRIPVLDVPNPNGLKVLASQSYSVSNASGAFFLWDAGTGPVGSILGFSREESSTDVAQELTQLIETQRAYSSNAKVIQTVDDMLQETTNLKR